MGNIENETHWFLQQILDETVYEHIKSQQLNQRFSLIERIVRSTSIESDEKKWCVEAIQLAKSLSEKRNLVAHNPLQMVMWEDEELNGTEHRYAFYKARDGEHAGLP